LSGFPKGKSYQKRWEKLPGKMKKVKGFTRDIDFGKRLVYTVTMSAFCPMKIYGNERKSIDPVSGGKRKKP